MVDVPKIISQKRSVLTTGNNQALESYPHQKIREALLIVDQRST